jgi:hypothetical protein
VNIHAGVVPVFNGLGEGQIGLHNPRICVTQINRALNSVSVTHRTMDNHIRTKFKGNIGRIHHRLISGIGDTAIVAVANES